MKQVGISGANLSDILRLVLSQTMYLTVKVNKFSLDDATKILVLLHEYMNGKIGATNDEVKAFAMYSGLRISDINTLGHRLGFDDIAKEVSTERTEVYKLIKCLSEKLKNSNFPTELHSMLRTIQYKDDGQRLENFELIQVATEMVEL